MHHLDISLPSWLVSIEHSLQGLKMKKVLFVFDDLPARQRCDRIVNEPQRFACALSQNLHHASPFEVIEIIECSCHRIAAYDHTVIGEKQDISEASVGRLDASKWMSNQCDYLVVSQFEFSGRSRFLSR